MLASAIMCSGVNFVHAAGLQLEEIVVTAQKRSENINEVPMSISALGGEELMNKGFSDTEDLVKVVPGFTVTKTNSNSPVFSLRGVGLYLYDSGVGASPAVSVYIDEVGLPSPAMTSGVSFDLERVEVLKGPQGTLFGQNATGGAINFIAAKPTEETTAGVTVSIDQHNKTDIEAFVSGALTDTLLARLAIGSTQGGAWQESVTRPNDELGDKDQFQARLLLDWQATDNLSLKLNVTTATDESDSAGAQFTVYHPGRVVGGTHPDPVAHAGLTATPVLGNADPEDADWTPGTNFADNSFDFYSVRADYDISDSLTLNSLTAYQEVEIDMLIDQDGSAVEHLNINPIGSAETFSQELRLSGDTDRIRWVAGLSYEQSDIINNLYYFNSNLAANYAFGPSLAYQTILTENTSDVKTKAAFTNIEYNITESFAAQAGIRYTDSSRDAINCNYGDENGPQNFINAIGAVLGPGSYGFGPGDCFMLEASLGAAAVPTGVIEQTLDENNTSWRVGLTYTTDSDTILYGNVSRGYKSGTIIPSGGLVRKSFEPTVQEELTAYEAGFKASLFDNRAQLNGALFFYDYKDKQVPTVVPDSAFVRLPALGNVPESEVKGLELQLITVLAEGLDLSLAATYLSTEVTSDFVVADLVSSANVNGSDLPNTPELSFVSDLQYRWSLTSDMDMLVGTSVTYVDEALARFQDSATEPAPVLPSYTLVDVRVGISSSDDTWQVQLWGRNVADEHYFTSDNNSVDTSYRYAGQGANYGLTFSYRM
ncbi:MAG: TonB-dependent receptor [Gammaproteobacteria bacterium]|nr:TonB-dependent receptor [Gammaproteobacteria bacterium]